MVRRLDPEKREAYLNTALTLFAAQGVADTSTAQIAREAGTAAGTLFIYFPTRQDLVNELVLRISREHAAHITVQLEPGLSVRETFHTIWTGSIQWFTDNPEAYNYLQQVRDSGIISPEVEQETAGHLAYYFEVIERGLKERAIKPYSYHLIGNVLYYDIVAVVNLLRSEAHRELHDTIVEHGFEIFWNGIRNR
jgi:AcrR family transcriptional regulator